MGRKTIYSGMYPYMGGKGWMIEKLSNLINQVYYNKFYDLFGGSGTVTLHSDILCDERHLNDLDEGNAILYYALSDEQVTNAMITVLENFDLTQESFNAAQDKWYKYINDPYHIKPENLLAHSFQMFVELAVAAYVLHLCFYGGVIKRSHTTISSEVTERFYKKASCDMLESYYEKLKDVTIHNQNAIDIINGLAANTGNTDSYLLYADVPYLSSNLTDTETKKTYNNGMTPQDHKVLLDAFNKLNRNCYTVFISNYSNDTYDEFAEANDWHKICVGERAITCSSAKKGLREKEFIYSNVYIDCSFCDELELWY